MREHKVNLNGDVIIVGENSSEEQRAAFKDRVKSTMRDTVDLVLGFLKCIALLVLCVFFILVECTLICIHAVFF
jgi:hypothetical protein